MFSLVGERGKVVCDNGTISFRPSPYCKKNERRQKEAGHIFNPEKKVWFVPKGTGDMANPQMCWDIDDPAFIRSLETFPPSERKLMLTCIRKGPPEHLILQPFSYNSIPDEFTDRRWKSRPTHWLQYEERSSKLFNEWLHYQRRVFYYREMHAYP